MGSCLSKKEASASAVKDPDPEEQEETVKEVLSETPKPRATGSSLNLNNGKGLVNGDDEERSEPEASEPDACSFTSDAFSTASTVMTAPEKRDVELDDHHLNVDPGAAAAAKRNNRRMSTNKTSRYPQASAKQLVLQRNNNNNNNNKGRSHSGEFQVQKKEERGVEVGCRSRRSSPSPAGRRTTADGGRAREAGGAGLAGRTRPNSSGFSGDRSGRMRSVSPAVKRGGANGQCRPSIPAQARSATANGNGGGGASSPQRVRMVGGSATTHPNPNPNPNPNQEVATTNGEGAAAASESLENPLVSLECFIFL